MKAIFTSFALLIVISANSQVELTSLDFGTKINYFNFKQSELQGVTFTAQAVLNQHFVANLDYATSVDFQFLNLFWARNLGTYPSLVTTYGANAGYRFDAHDRFKIDLTGGLHYYHFEEVVVHGYEEQSSVWDIFPQEQRWEQSKRGIGTNVNLKANWLCTKYVGLTFGLGAKTHVHTVPYAEFGLNFGMLR